MVYYRRDTDEIVDVVILACGLAPRGNTEGKEPFVESGIQVVHKLRKFNANVMVCGSSLVSSARHGLAPNYLPFGPEGQWEPPDFSAENQPLRDTDLHPSTLGSQVCCHPAAAPF